MKTKILSLAVIAAVSFLSLKQLAPKKNEVMPKYALGLPFAKGGTGVNCDVIIQSAVGGEPAIGAYANHVLDHVHHQLYRFNKMESADIEMVFCQMVNRFEFNPDLSQLPQNLSFSIGGGAHTYSLAVTAPTEAFAATLGYQAKAIVKFDGTAFITMWWSGNSTSSKGYLIQKSNPLATDSKRLKYAQWDRTGAQQVVKILTTAFKTTYLAQSNYANTVDPSKLGGDRVHFGRAVYDIANNSISSQSVEIHQDFANPNAFACYKMQIAGTIGGSLSAYRPALGSPEAVNSNTKNGTNMDGVTGVNDSQSTADGAGTIDAAPASLPVAFDYSCDDLNTAGSSGGVFQSSTVDFSLNPSVVFPN